MSRNYELLAQIETDLDATTDHNPSFANRSAPLGDVLTNSGDVFQDEMRRLVQRVFLSASAIPPRQVVFCGVERDNGSTSVCANAARTLAANISQSVCVADGNLRSPRLADALGIVDTIPIFGESSLKGDGCIQIGSNLWFGGTDVLSNESGALPPVDKLKERLARLHDIFEYVLIDAPGTNVCEDASKLAQLAGAAVLVIDANRTRRITARKAMEALEASHVRLLGTVLHNRSFPIPERLYKRL
jgi:Mrp family chromosome partitioning ATPase